MSKRLSNSRSRTHAQHTHVDARAIYAQTFMQRYANDYHAARANANATNATRTQTQHVDIYTRAQCDALSQCVHAQTLHEYNARKHNATIAHTTITNAQHERVHITYMRDAYHTQHANIINASFKCVLCQHEYDNNHINDEYANVYHVTLCNTCVHDVDTRILQTYCYSIMMHNTRNA